MSIKSRITKLEKLNREGLEVIVPEVEFAGGSIQEDCTHAVAFWGDGNSHRVDRNKGEGFSDFRRHFVEGYVVGIQKQLSDDGVRAVVLEHDADLL